MSNENVCDLNDENFDGEVLGSLEPVLVRFWAPWCNPCRLIAPNIDALATEFTGRVRMVKVNTDQAPGIATTYGVHSIPTILIFKAGQLVDKFIGVTPKDRLAAALNKHLA